jgi:cytoskeleton protein RodZ
MITNGETFRSARQQRNLSIDEVSKRTKIGVRVIESIESDNLQALPPAYMRSFVKTYSQFLNIPEPDLSLDDKPLAERFQPQHTEFTSPLSMPKDVFTPGYFSDQSARTKRLLTIIYSTVGCLIVVAGYLVLAASKVPRKADDTMITRPLRIIAETIKPGSTLDSATLAKQINTDSLVLEARANENVWMNVVMDKKRSEQITLEAGRIYRWSAEKQLAIALGNAGGAMFTLNGRPLQQFGQKGEVVRDVRITRDAMRREVISSSNNPTIIRNIDGSLAQAADKQGAATQAATEKATEKITQIATQKPTQVANTSTPSNTSLNTAPSLASTSNSTDSVKSRPRFSARRREQPKIISPVVPSIAPPKPQFGTVKAPTTNQIKNN